MASSTLTASANASSNSDLPSTTLCSSHHHIITPTTPATTTASRLFGSMSMDDFFQNLYADASGNASPPHAPPPHPPKAVDHQSWKEQREEEEEEMTLEDFLSKAGAVREEDFLAKAGAARDDGDSLMLPQQQQHEESSLVLPFVNGSNARGRGKRRAAEHPPLLDRATQQRQRRMIKNRESAARSRERKQAHTIELEAQVTLLEEENMRLIREEAEQTKQRFKQLMENLIPVVEERKPPRALRRVNSVQW